MLKFLVGFLFVAGIASAAENSRLDRVFQGVAGTLASAEYSREFAPERADLTLHAVAGGAISTLVGALATPGAGWKTGVIIGAGKELVNDALLQRGHPQVDDFLVTAAASVLSSGISPSLATFVTFNDSGAGIRFSHRF